MSIPPSQAHTIRGGWRAAACLALLALVGCATPVAQNDPALLGPFYQPRNYSGVAELPATVRRVVLLPVAAEKGVEIETLRNLDQVLARALQQQQRFEVVSLSRADCATWFGVGQLGSTELLPHDFLREVTHRFGADAVLFVDVTAYKAYRPLLVGFRAKLATPAGEQLLWSFDEIIAAEDPGVANSARRHFLWSDRSGQPLDLSRTVLQSPSRFAAYAADAMFQTLPPRPSPRPANER